MFGSQPWGSVPWTAERALDTSILADAVESTSATDTRSLTSVSINPAQAEPASATHTQAVIPQTNRNEPATAVDAPNVLLMYAWRFQTETANAIDTETVTMIVARSDSVTATETSNRTMSAAPDRVEAATATDAPNRSMSAQAQQTEPTTATETESGALNPNVSIIEYIPTKLVPGNYPYTALDLLTFDRNSSATYIDGSGNLQSVGNDVIRFQSGQMLIEAEGFNALRNNTMAGAAAGSPGTRPTNWSLTLGTLNGVAFRISAVGTENGIPYIDYELNGVCTTSVNTFPQLDSLTLQAANLGEQWTSSIYTKIVSGSVPAGSTPTVSVSGRLAGGNQNEVSNTPINLGTGALSSQRVSVSRTLNTTGTVTVGEFLTIPLVAGQTYMYTLRIGSAQLERGLSATSLILTSGAQATRLADDAWLLPLDIPDRTMQAQASRTDSLTPTHSQDAIQVVLQDEVANAQDTENAVHVTAQAEPTTATESASQQTSAQASRTEPATASSQQDATAFILVDRLDVSTPADNQVVLMVASAVASDAGTVTDTTNRVAGLNVTRTDSTPITDEVGGGIVREVSRDESTTPTDTQVRALVITKLEEDTASATDTSNRTASIAGNEVENGLAVDNTNGGPLRTASQQDIGTATNTQNGTPVTPVARTEPATATDAPNKTLTANVQRTDTVTPTDTQAPASLVNGADIVEQENLTDTITQQTSVSATRSDALSPTDTPVKALNVDASRTDTGNASDTQNRVAATSRQENEPAQAVDTPTNTMINSVTESTTPSDNYFALKLTEVGRSDSATPTDTASVSALFNRWLQEDTVAIDTSSVLAFMQALQVDQAAALDRPNVVDFTVSVTIQELATANEVANGMVTKMAEHLANANAVDLQAAAISMIRQVQEMNPALDVAAAVAHAQVVVAEGAAATDWCAIVIPVGQTDGTDATDTCAVFVYDANRMLLVFDKDCHC